MICQNKCRSLRLATFLVFFGLLTIALVLFVSADNAKQKKQNMHTWREESRATRRPRIVSLSAALEWK